MPLIEEVGKKEKRTRPEIKKLVNKMVDMIKIISVLYAAIIIPLALSASKLIVPLTQVYLWSIIAIIAYYYTQIFIKTLSSAKKTKKKKKETPKRN